MKLIQLIPVRLWRMRTVSALFCVRSLPGFCSRGDSSAAQPSASAFSSLLTSSSTVVMCHTLMDAPFCAVDFCSVIVT